MMKKSMCELCNKKASLHCESDEARLCFECDEKVHGANFLVAKHCRTLLCHVCQSTTPWKASGPKLFPTISLCVNCSDNKNNSRIEEEEEEEEEEEKEEEINQPQMRDQQNNYEDNDEAQSEDDDDDGNQEYSSSDEDDDDDDDDEGENQVVPWSPSPPIASSSSCSEEEVVEDGGAAASLSSTFKRIRQTDYLDYQDDDERSLPQTCGMSSLSSMRPWKLARNGDSS